MKTLWPKERERGTQNKKKDTDRMGDVERKSRRRRTKEGAAHLLVVLLFVGVFIVFLHLVHHTLEHVERVVFDKLLVAQHRIQVLLVPACDQQ